MGLWYRRSFLIENAGVDYFSTNLLSAGTISLVREGSINYGYIEYSSNNGRTWTRKNVTAGQTTIASVTLNRAGSVLWRSLNWRSESTNYWHFSCTTNYTVSGNLMSLCYGSKHTRKNKAKLTGSDFNSLFKDSTTLISAENLKFGCTDMGEKYILLGGSMSEYQSCLGMRTDNMFNGCTALTTPPKVIPFKRLVPASCNSMFYGCTSLTTAPEIVASEIWRACCKSMFYGCTSLKIGPKFSNTITQIYELQRYVSNEPFGSMFSGCNQLEKIYLPEGVFPDETYCRNWHNRNNTVGTFVWPNNFSESQLDGLRGVNGIPKGWTIITSE